MSADKEETLRQFCDVTGTDEARSRFFLESSNWQLEVALSSFYEHGGNADEVVTGQSTAAAPLPSLSDSDMESPTATPSKSSQDKKKTASSKFATLDSLHQDSSSDEEEGQAFYAGGSERSGQQILGPGKGRKDIVTEMFKSARQLGAVVFEDEPSTASRGHSGGVFSGAGYRLGQTADDHEQVTPTNTQSQGNSRLVPLCLYREGFTVDGGPLRLYSDPQNAEFLSYVRRSEIPPELANSGGQIRVSLQDRRHEDCPKHVTKAPVFSGKGHLLGSPTPVTVGATAPLASAPDDRAANHRAAQDGLHLDETRPTTTVQFRLADGTRLTGRFNHTHTVGDLAAYIARAEPAYQLRPFALLTTYPSTELADPTVTLQAANLLNSTVMQRLK